VLPTGNGLEREPSLALLDQRPALERAQRLQERWPGDYADEIRAQRLEPDDLALDRQPDQDILFQCGQAIPLVATSTGLGIVRDNRPYGEASMQQAERNAELV